MSSMTAFLVTTLVREDDRKRNAKDRHQLQLYGVFAYLGFRNHRIVEYKPHEVALSYTEAVKYCRNAQHAIAQPEDKKDLFYGLQGILQRFCALLLQCFSPRCYS